MNPYNDKSSNFKGAKIKGKQHGQEDYTILRDLQFGDALHLRLQQEAEPKAEPEQRQAKQ